MPPLPKTGTMTAEERGQNTTHAILYALDAETGEELFSSEDLDRRLDASKQHHGCRRAGLRDDEKVVRLRVRSEVSAEVRHDVCHRGRSGRRAGASCPAEAGHYYAAGQQPPPASDPIARGADLFAKSCSTCHGQGGAGGRASALAGNRRTQSLTDAEIQGIIRNGTSAGMPPFPALSAAELESVTTFVRSLIGSPDRGSCGRR